MMLRKSKKQGERRRARFAAERAGAWVALTAALALPGACRADDPQLVTSDGGDRTQIDVTVYNQDLALVRELRSIELPKGEFQLEFRDVPSRIDPVTLLVVPAGKSGLELLEQNYEYDLMSREKILQKYVGRELSWIQEDGSRIQGKLLGMNDGPVFEVDREVVFEVPGRLALPALPQNLRARPTLVWLAEARKAGTESIETTYLTGGFSWQTDYVLQLDSKGEKADLQAWVTVRNQTGASYRDAKLLLVAGDIHRAAPPTPDKMMVFAAEAKARGGESDFQEESLYDYHLYTLQRPTTLLDQQIKQISLFEAAGMQVQRHYRLRSSAQVFRGGWFAAGDQKVDVSYSFENRQENRLGLPLPAGVFRVYGRSEAGSRQLLGEDRIDHTPVKEKVELTVGKAFDIVAERVRKENVRLEDNRYRSTFTVTIRNHKEEDVTVEVSEPVGGFWTVIESNFQARRVSATELAFDLPVRADGETVLTYTVEVKY